MNASTHKLNASDLIQFISLNNLNPQSVDYENMIPSFESNSKILDNGKLALIKEESIHQNNFIKNIRKASN